MKTPKRIQALRGRHFHQWVRCHAPDAVIGEIGQEVQFTLLETWLRDLGFRASVSLMGEVEINGQVLYLGTGAMDFSMCYQECGGDEEIIRGSRDVTCCEVLPYAVYLRASRYSLAR
jgi:hypothetical protein